MRIAERVKALREAVNSLREESEELLKVAEEKNEKHIANVAQALLNISKMLSATVRMLEAIFPETASPTEAIFSSSGLEGSSFLHRGDAAGKSRGGLKR